MSELCWVIYLSHWLQGNGMPTGAPVWKLRNFPSARHHDSYQTPEVRQFLCLQFSYSSWSKKKVNVFYFTESKVVV